MVSYTAVVNALPAAPAAREPVAYTVTITRSAAAPSALALKCAFYDGEAATVPSADNSDASFKALPVKVSATMAAGSTTATCVVPPVFYTSAGTKLAKVQVFEGDDGTLGLLGVGKPASRSTTVGGGARAPRM